MTDLPRAIYEFIARMAWCIKMQLHSTYQEINEYHYVDISELFQSWTFIR